MATCNRGHEPIVFESPFSALCPLCQVLQKAAEDIAEIRNHSEQAEADAQDDVTHAERRANEAEEALAKCKDRYEGH